MQCLKYPLILGSQNGVSVPRLPTMQPFSPVSLTARLPVFGYDTLLFPRRLILFTTCLPAFSANEEGFYR